MKELLDRVSWRTLFIVLGAMLIAGSFLGTFD